MKKILLVTFSLLAGAVVAAQQPVMISIGGGLSSPSSTVKTDAYAGNGYHLQGEVFIPFLRKGRNAAVKDGRFALGAIAGGTYHTSENLTPDLAGTQAAYKLYNGNLNIANVQKGASTSKGFIASAGLRADFAVGPLTLSPAISGGFFSLKQAGFTQQGTLDGKPIVLTALQGTKTTGFAAIPQIRAGYPLTGNLGIYAAVLMPMGPEINTTQGKLVPAGGFNDKGTYEPAQLSSGTMKEKTVRTPYQALNISAGASWVFGSSARRLKGKVTKPGGNVAKQSNPLYEPSGNSAQNPMHNPSAMAAPGNPIGGIIVKGGKNPGPRDMLVTSNDKGAFELNGLEAGSYQFTLTPAVNPQGKSINEKGVKRSEAAEAARPGSPIGGIVVKGGKNPGGNMTTLTVDKNGTIQFDVLEPGNYRFIIQTADGADGTQMKKKKVVEKATSGLKDTLKTNV